VALLIDTAVVPPRERLDFWSDASCDEYHPLQIRSAATARFWARMWGYELGPMALFRIAGAANTMIRTSRAIAAGDPECIHVSVILRGRMNAAQEGRTGVALAGDVISYETSHPAVLSADGPFEVLVVQVPRRLLGREAARVAGLTAVRVAGGDAARFFTRLEERAAAPPDVDGVLDRVRSLYADPARADESRRLRSRAEILLRVESFIEEHLGDPGLDPEEIARASFISTRYLHKLFEAKGTSVCEWIRATRLERCRRDLLDPALDHQTILSIASRWGLPGAQHFSRLFRTAYGCSPRELRRAGYSPESCASTSKTTAKSRSA
jgi:AraC-like DNA-binding protein